MKRHGYGLLVAAGLLAGPFVLAQGTQPSPAPATQQGGTSTPQAGSRPCEPMMGQGEMMGHGMGGAGMGGAGMGCPMHGMADVMVEQTPTGAILRLTAKNPDQVAAVQQHARMMENCISGGQSTESGSNQQKK